MRITITAAIAVVSLFGLPACPRDAPVGDDGGIADAASDDGGTTDGGGDGGTACVAGEMDLCGCPDGSISDKLCQADATWGACDCGGPCAAGEQDGGDGRCVPTGTCSPGYHDAGDGTCAAEGLCIFGFHDGGDGVCVPEGACSASFRIGAGGVCGLPEPCAAGIAVTPDPVAFGPWPVGESTVQSVTLENLSAFDACPLAQVALAPGSDPTFTLSIPSSMPAVLAPGASATVELSFAPVDEERQNAILSITLGDAASTYQAVRLSGQGFTYSVSASPLAIDFGVGTLDCPPPSQTVCIQNDSTRPVEFSRAVLSAPGFALVSLPTLPATIAVGDALCFGIAYRPVFIGTSSASLQIAITPGGTPLYIELIGEALDSVPVTETLPQGPGPKADILWVVSSSITMGNLDQTLALTTLGGELITRLEQGSVDYQVAVVTTDGLNSPTPGLMEPQDRSRPHIVDPGLSNPSQALADNLQPVLSTGIATQENLEVARLALSAPLHTDPALNGGFLRPDAALALLFLTTANELSDTTTDYRGFFESLHGASRSEQFTASVISGPPPFGCNMPEGPALGAPRLWDLATQSGGFTGDVCDPLQRDLVIQDLADSFELPSRFPLGAPADATGSFTVEIADAGGNVQPATGWSYDAGANAIDFAPGSVPQPGESVVVTFTAACN